MVAELCLRELFPEDGDCRLVPLHFSVRGLLVPGAVILADDAIAQALVQGLRSGLVHVDTELDFYVATVDGPLFQRFDEDRAYPARTQGRVDGQLLKSWDSGRIGVGHDPCGHRYLGWRADSEEVELAACSSFEGEVGAGEMGVRPTEGSWIKIIVSEVSHRQWQHNFGHARHTVSSSRNPLAVSNRRTGCDARSAIHWDIHLVDRAGEPGATDTPAAPRTSLIRWPVRAGQRRRLGSPCVAAPHTSVSVVG